MDGAGTGRRVLIYVSEDDTWHHQATYKAVLELLRREGCAGATVLRGIMGFTRGRIATASLVELSSGLPVVIDWVDTPERVRRLLPALCEMVPDGLITVANRHSLRSHLREQTESIRLLARGSAEEAASI